MKINVIYITDLFPTENNPVRGIFIMKRLEAAKKAGIKFVVFATEFKETWDLTLIRKIFRKPPRIIQQFIKKDIPFQNIPVRFSLLDRIIVKTMKKKKTIARQAAKYISNVVGSSYSVIHAHGMYEIGAGLIAMYLSELLNIPYIVTLHGSDVNRVMPRMQEVFVKVLENASKVIFVSEKLRMRAMEFGYSGGNSAVIPNGYDPSVFHPMDKKSVRKELKVLKEGYKYVGFVGGLNHAKRADKLPEIFHVIAKQVRKVRFFVIGDGTLRKFVEKNTENLDIVLTGMLPQQEVAKWMNAMDVVILPSREEGFGAVIVEAMACGTAVIGSNNGGIPETIGFKEFVVEEGKDFEERFANKVIKVLDEGYDPTLLIERAKKFTWESIFKKEKECYLDILARSQNR